jgi:hypothetical protein
MKSRRGSKRPDNVAYKVVRLAGGVSFVHVSPADTRRVEPLPELAAFKEFGRGAAAWVATAPVPLLPTSSGRTTQWFW